MSRKCEAGFPLPVFGACPECGASENDGCLLVHRGKPTPVGTNPDALEDLHDALKSITEYPDVREHVGSQIHNKALTALSRARGETGDEE